MTTRLSNGPKLETSLETYDKLHEIAKSGRGKYRKVSVDDLERLLVDHSRMAKLLGVA